MVVSIPKFAATEAIVMLPLTGASTVPFTRSTLYGLSVSKQSGQAAPVWFAWVHSINVKPPPPQMPQAVPGLVGSYPVPWQLEQISMYWLLK